MSAAACGKKGPPLAPLLRVPAAVETLEATRAGSDVYVTLTIPARNVDDFTPADLERVEVYGYTGRSGPPDGRFGEFGTRIAVVPVARPQTEEAAAPAADVPAQGASITVRDRLTADELQHGRVANVEPRTASQEPGTRTPNTNLKPGTGSPELPLRRFYAAYGFSARGRFSPPGTVAELPLLPMPDAPPRAEATYDERQVTIRWEPAGGLIGFLLERPLSEELPPPTVEIEKVAAGPVDAGALRYNVYRAITPDPLAPPGGGAEAWNASLPEPINVAPLATMTFSDPVRFGTLSCYTVRAVRGVGGGARVGEPSPPACVAAIDTFPPDAPRSLAAVAVEGAISLIWQPNVEPDLGGYLVLRGEAPGATLQPLTPVRDARYRDEAVTPGARYVYAVVALDSRFPLPNVSAESNRVEETAR